MFATDTYHSLPRSKKGAPLFAAPLLFAELLALSAGLAFAAGCGGAASGSGGASSSPPPAISVGITPLSASVLLGDSTPLAASVANATNTAVVWSVAGIPGGNSTVGTISASGVFTAPQSLPSPASVSVQAASVADPSKSAAATVTLLSDIAVNARPAGAGVELGAQQSFTAAVSSAGNPLTSVVWTLSGAGCAAAACGAITPAGQLTAPQILPSPPTVLLTATSVADSSRSGSVAVTITSHFTLSLVGPSPVASGTSANFSATLSAAPNSNPSTTINWSVSGPGCGGGVCGTIAAIGSGATSLFAAPPLAPSPDQITVTATPLADPSKAISMTIAVSAAAGITVTVAPSSITLAPSAAQLFTATVAGAADQGVSWAISGAACAAAGNPCGTIDQTGSYQAPSLPPSPNNFQVVATSAADTSRSGFAAVTISTLPSITSLAPSSATVGAAGGFLLDVEGGNFVPSSPGPGSAILVGGSVRTTLCSSDLDCTTTLTAADLAAAGNLNVAVENPDGTFSSAVAFVVAAQTLTPDTILLSAGSPAATVRDILVVDLSTAGSPGGASLSIVAIGALQPGNACALSAGPVELAPPASGSVAADICAFSLSGLDPGYAYTLTGPSPADVTLIGTEPLGLGIVGLILQLPALAQPGARTLFIQNSNLDLTAATGALDVQ